MRKFPSFRGFKELVWVVRLVIDHLHARIIALSKVVHLILAHVFKAPVLTPYFTRHDQTAHGRKLNQIGV